MATRIAPQSTETLEVTLTATPVADDERRARLEDPGFGRIFGEHMVVIHYDQSLGWARGHLQPYGSLTLDPAAMVLHYGQAIFEGFKAYRQADGGVASFRPEANGARLNASARRMAMPELPVERFVEAADALVRADQDWVPDGDGESLYLRPFMFATEVGLGVRPSATYDFMLFASPSGSYFKSGVKPVTVFVSEEYVRAAPGGTGAAKVAGNYAASLLAQAQAIEQGCDQVVWLDAVERRFVEEMGGMNLYFVFGEGPDARLVTPELTGSLLPGITRDTLLMLAREAGHDVEERRISLDEWRESNADGSLTEVFACGTAAVITPVGHVKTRTGEFRVADGEAGPVATALRARLLDLQHGRAADPHGWMHRVI